MIKSNYIGSDKMLDTIENTKLLSFQKNLSNCVNTKKKLFNNKEVIISSTSLKKQIGFIIYGQANIIKTDINGNTTILRDLKINDIFSNLFFQQTEDEIYIISNNQTEIIFIDYYSILKNCTKSCPFHNTLVLTLYDLLINDNKKQNEKIELLSQKTVRDRFLYFLKNRTNKNNIFRVTTSYKAIAEYICVDRSNLMRELNKLEEEHIIKRNKDIIYYLK